MTRRAGAAKIGAVEMAELLSRVEAVFAETALGMARWDDPHPDRNVRDEEYSRVTNPQKWRIVSARTEAWITALANAGLATVERDATIRWGDEPRPLAPRGDRLMPAVAGGVPLTVIRSAIGGVDGAGVVLGVGDPTWRLALIPDCGCDACDCGSQSELGLVDDHVSSVVSGHFRRLWSGRRTITVLTSHRRASWVRGREIDAVLADPRGWDELTGPSWLT